MKLKKEERNFLLIVAALIVFLCTRPAAEVDKLFTSAGLKQITYAESP